MKIKSCFQPQKMLKRVTRVFENIFNSLEQLNLAKLQIGLFLLQPELLWQHATIIYRHDDPLEIF